MMKSNWPRTAAKDKLFLNHPYPWEKKKKKPFFIWDNFLEIKKSSYSYLNREHKIEKTRLKNDKKIANKMVFRHFDRPLK